MKTKNIFTAIREKTNAWIDYIFNHQLFFWFIGMASAIVCLCSFTSRNYEDFISFEMIIGLFFLITMSGWIIGILCPVLILLFISYPFEIISNIIKYTLIVLAILAIYFLFTWLTRENKYKYSIEDNNNIEHYEPQW